MTLSQGVAPFFNGGTVLHFPPFTTLWRFGSYLGSHNFRSLGPLPRLCSPSRKPSYGPPPLPQVVPLSSGPLPSTVSPSCPASLSDIKLKLFKIAPYDACTFSDDLTIEPYISSYRSYMGSQRKGVLDPLPEADSYSSHLSGALELPFPLSVETPLPSDFRRALSWISSAPSSEISLFWSSQLSTLRTLSMDPLCSSENWYSLRPPAFARSPSSLNVALVAQLANFCNMGGAGWLEGYIRGFPISGSICQSGVFPLTLKPDNPHPIPRSSLFNGAVDRFRARSVRRPPHSHTLWKEALEQVASGWLEPPRLLNSSGRFADSPDTPIVNAFRFAVIQGEKIRACDDLKASLTNSSCSVLTPISLPSWEHLAQACLLVADSGTDWSLGKGDESDAYKKQPLLASDSLLAVTTLMGPDGRWYGLVPRSQIFGSTASVIHYNTFSRLLASLICRLLGLPCIGYFDDYAFLVPRTLQDLALTTFKEFCAILGVILKDSKCSVGPINTFLGLRGDFPSRRSGMKLTISLDQEKSFRWIELISDILKSPHIDHSSLDKLIGKLSFAQTTIFGKFARTLAQPLYDMLNAQPFCGDITDELRVNLRWWRHALASIRSRIVSFRPPSPHFIIYTDASWSDKKGKGRIAALLFEQSSGRLLETLSSEAPSRLAKLFLDANSSAIYGLELFALVAAFAVWQARLAGLQVTAFVDNDPASNGVVKGSAGTAIAKNFIRRFWQLALIRSIFVWIERVPSPLNWADMPTRGVELPVKSKLTREFPLLNELIDLFLAQWSEDSKMKIVNSKRS